MFFGRASTHFYSLVKALVLKNEIMADKNNKYSENAPGPFYVDRECINCDACILVAENHFKSNEDYTYVYKQPQNEEERQLCEEAMEACPVEAIGCDGENKAL